MTTTQIKSRLYHLTKKLKHLSDLIDINKESILIKRDKIVDPILKSHEIVSLEFDLKILIRETIALERKQMNVTKEINDLENLLK